MRGMRWLSFCVAAGLAGLLAVSSVRADRQCEGISLPEKIQSLGETLVLNGLGMRRATFLKVHVYVGGLYLSAPTRNAAEALKPSRSKELTLHFVRNVSRKEIADAIRDGLSEIPHVNVEAAHGHVRSMERYLGDLPTGTVLQLAFKPKEGLHVYTNGKLVGVEKDDVFANLLFQVWLGEHPPDEGLKKGLLGGPCP